MSISFDRAKCNRNIVERGLSFELAAEFEWSTAVIAEDIRKDYGEPRFQAVGLIGERLHVLVFTPPAGNVHVISLLKSNFREVRKYEAQSKS